MPLAPAPPPTLVLVTGPPGTGKSTLAEAAAGTLGAAVLAWDWVMAGLTGFEAVQEGLRRLDKVGHRRVGWSMLRNLATAQLRHGRSVVLDGCARVDDIDVTRRTAAAEAARCLVVVTRLTDPSVHRRRIESRSRAIPGWHELDWAHVQRFLADWTEPAGADLYLDATDSPAHNAARLHDLLVAD